MSDTPTPDHSPANPSPPPSGQQEAAVWRRVANSLATQLNLRAKNQDEEEDELANAVAVGIIVVGLLIVGFLFIRPFLKQPPVDPAYHKLESIKRIQHLTLVRQHYETLIPITKKDDPNKLEFLLKAPVQINGYVDLSEVEFMVREDSLVIVALPAMRVDTPNINWEKIDVYTMRKSFWAQLPERLKKLPYEDAYDQIRDAMADTKSQIVHRAFLNGLHTETEQKVKQYLMSLITSMGYRVQFLPAIKPAYRGDSLSGNYEAMLQRLRLMDIGSGVSPGGSPLRQLMKSL